MNDAEQGAQLPERAPSVTRRGALLRLVGLAGATAAAAGLPTVAAAGAESGAATVLPDWLADRPDWFVANVERYARALATMQNPLGLRSERRDGTREGELVWFVEILIEGMNAHPEPWPKWEHRPAPDPKPEPKPVPVWIASDRIATARIRKLDRNERRRVRRWLARRPVGDEHPIIRLRPGRYRDERAVDFLDVAQANRHHYLETPYSLLQEVVFEVGQVLKCSSAR